jgi:hypothetical protein
MKHRSNRGGEASTLREDHGVRVRGDVGDTDSSHLRLSRLSRLSDISYNYPLLLHRPGGTVSPLFVVSRSRQSFFADGTPRRLEVRQREALMQIKHRERAQQRGYAMQYASRHVQSVTLVTI